MGGNHEYPRERHARLGGADKKITLPSSAKRAKVHDWVALRSYGIIGFAGRVEKQRASCQLYSKPQSQALMHGEFMNTAIIVRRIVQSVPSQDEDSRTMEASVYRSGGVVGNIICLDAG